MIVACNDMLDPQPEERTDRHDPVIGGRRDRTFERNANWRRFRNKHLGSEDCSFRVTLGKPLAMTKRKLRDQSRFEFSRSFRQDVAKDDITRLSLHSRRYGDRRTGG